MFSSEGKRTLPQLPNAENLRKQAKARLVEMRSNISTARLAHAQLVLAREYGFSTWAALQEEVARRTDGPRGQRSRIRKMPQKFQFSAFNSDFETEDSQMPFHAGAAIQVGFVVLFLIGMALLAFTLKFSGALK
jgi:hypothetical protein